MRYAAGGEILGGGKGNGRVKSMTLEDEIRDQVKNERIALYKLSKEEKRLTGYNKETQEYDTGMMLDHILERNLDRWREELASKESVEEQDYYYRTVIYPHIQYLEWRIEDRHGRHGDDREFEQMALYDDTLDGLEDAAYRESPDFLHELVTDAALCGILRRLTPDQKEVIYNNAVSGCSVTDISVIKKTTDRNIRKIKNTALRHIRGQYLPVVMFKYKIQTDEKYRWLYVQGISTSHWERLFAATVGADYTDYYDGMAFDFVEITKDYRAWDRRDRDWVANRRDERRRREEILKKKKELQKQLDNGKMIDDDYYYEEGTDDSDAQDI
jgi:hypothetical protein